MTKKEKRNERIRINQRNVDFDQAMQWLYDQGFLLEQINGSHHILRHPGTKTKLNFQPDKSGNAKPYQLKQALKAIDLLNL